MADFSFRSPDCCLPAGSLKKMQRVWIGPAALLADKRFKDSLRLVGRRLRFSNMVCERLLALFGSAVGGQMKHSCVERVSSSGVAAQVKVAHHQLGRDNPGVTERKDLIAECVPIAAAADHKVKKSSVWSLCMQKREARQLP